MPRKPHAKLTIISSAPWKSVFLVGLLLFVLILVAHYKKFATERKREWQKNEMLVLTAWHNRQSKASKNWALLGAWHILHDSGVEAEEGIQLLVCSAMTRLVILRERKGGFAVQFARVGMWAMCRSRGWWWREFWVICSRNVFLFDKKWEARWKFRGTSYHVMS